MTRTEQISNLREQGYDIVEITVSKGNDNKNRPSAFMLNRETGDGVLISHTGDVVPVTLIDKEIT